MIRRLYNWTIHWAASPRALPALVVLSFAESSFFPIPPDFLLIPMVMALPAQGMRYAAWCTVASALGGGFGYFIGYSFWQWLGQPILNLYGLQAGYDQAVALFAQYDVWIVAIAGFSPIPYKLFTITAGALHSDFVSFMITSLFARGARFFLVAGLLMWGGERLRALVEKHLEALTMALTVLVVVGFLVVKMLL